MSGARQIDATVRALGPKLTLGQIRDLVENKRRAERDESDMQQLQVGGSPKASTTPKSGAQFSLSVYRQAAKGFDRNCLQCGRTWPHQTKKCRLSATTKCDSCGKSGHLKVVCLIAQMEQIKIGQKTPQVRSVSQSATAEPKHDDASAAYQASRAETANKFQLLLALPRRPNTYDYLRWARLLSVSSRHPIPVALGNIIQNSCAT